MDLSKISDADLMAMKSGDLTKVSDAGLMAMKGESAPTVPSSKQPVASWSDVPLEALKNLPSSAGHFVGGIYDAVTSPIETAKSLGTAAMGGLENAAYGLTRLASEQRAKNGSKPDPQYEQILTRGNTPAMTKADMIGQFYKDRYGGADQIKNTLATDPVGALADASLAGGAASKTAQLAGLTKTGQVIGEVSNAVNPINLGIQAVKPAIKATTSLTEKVASNLLGLSTGVGAENIRTAAKAGFERNPSFMDNLSGNVPFTEILDQAKGALQNMRNTRNAEYKANIGVTAADNTRLNFTPIEDAVKNVTASMQSNGHWKIGGAEVNKVKEVADIVSEWKADPKSHTAMGLDALKQRLDAVYPDSPVHNQAQRAITNVRNAVKDTIVDQSPQYANTMKAYEEAIRLEKEIERALSVGNKGSADTALRKLQSLSRNNVNTNYGHRLDLAKALEEQGGQSLLPAIAGQAMNSWTARGLTGQGGTMATLAAALQNPAMLGLLPLQSPKVVGSATYGAGQAARSVSDAAGAVGVSIPLSPAQIKSLATILSQTENAQGQR